MSTQQKMSVLISNDYNISISVKKKGGGGAFPFPTIPDSDAVWDAGLFCSVRGSDWTSRRNCGPPAHQWLLPEQHGLSVRVPAAGGQESGPHLHETQPATPKLGRKVHWLRAGTCNIQSFICMCAKVHLECFFFQIHVCTMYSFISLVSHNSFATPSYSPLFFTWSVNYMYAHSQKAENLTFI